MTQKRNTLSDEKKYPVMRWIEQQPKGMTIPRLTAIAAEAFGIDFKETQIRKMAKIVGYEYTKMRPGYSAGSTSHTRNRTREVTVCILRSLETLESRLGEELINEADRVILNLHAGRITAGEAHRRLDAMDNEEEDGALV